MNNFFSFNMLPNRKIQGYEYRGGEAIALLKPAAWPSAPSHADLEQKPTETFIVQQKN